MSFNNSLWVIGGAFNNGTQSIYNDAWYTTNGSSWVEATSSAAFGPRFQHSSVVFNGAMWVIGGNDPITNAYYKDVWYSSDGVNWAQATGNAPFNTRYGHASAVFNGAMWVIGGYNYSTSSTTNDVWYSTDGANWTQATGNAAFSPRLYPTALVYNNKIWVIGGEKWNGSAYVPLNDVWYSSNGISWSQATASAAFSARDHHTSLVYNNAMWVIGGSTSTTSSGVLNDSWYSTDGSNWSPLSGTPFTPARYRHSSAVFNNSMWVIAGFGTQYFGDVWRAP